MKGSVYVETLRDLRWTVAAWSAGVAFLAAINVLIFPSLQQMEGLVAFLENLPPVFKAMIGDIAAMTRLEGFLHVKLFDPLPLLLAIFGVSHGAQLLAGELEHKHVDLLLARPVRRWRVVLAKFLALTTGLALIALATALATWACARAIGAETSTARLLLGALNGLPLSWLFAAMAVFASALVSHPRPAAFGTGAVVVASYVLETLRLVSPTLAGWRPFSLFAHHKAAYPLTGAPDPWSTLLLLALAALFAAGAAAVWERRDLAA